jgi:hypothetical protein
LCEGQKNIGTWSPKQDNRDLKFLLHFESEVHAIICNYASYRWDNIWWISSARSSRDGSEQELGIELQRNELSWVTSASISGRTGRPLSEYGGSGLEQASVIVFGVDKGDVKAFGISHFATLSRGVMWPWAEAMGCTRHVPRWFWEGVPYLSLSCSSLTPSVSYKNNELLLCNYLLCGMKSFSDRRNTP